MPTPSLSSQRVRPQAIRPSAPVGDRLAVIDKQMKRGCGLCLIHWSTFVPKEKTGDKVLEWIGGYFDYESGPAKNGWYSKIQTVTLKATGRHPITTGMSPFEVKDEFYYNIRFRDRDPRDLSRS